MCRRCAFLSGEKTMIELRNLSKNFITADGPVDALKHVSLKINDGDIYGIIGMSGAGKSTLVRCINMLERPTDKGSNCEVMAVKHHKGALAAIYISHSESSQTARSDSKVTTFTP